MSMQISTNAVDSHPSSPPRHSHPYPNTLENNYLQETWESIAALDTRLPQQWDIKPQHQQYLADRGIGLESACYAGIFSASGELAQALVGRPDSCLVFSYFDPYGRKLYTWKHPSTGEVNPFYRARLDVPDGKQKFASPPRSRVLPYWPRVRGFNWLDTPTMGHQIPSDLKGKDLLGTEGEAKALCGTLHGFPTLGLGGVWGWMRKKNGEGGEGSDQLLQELYDFDWSVPRRIIIVFDSDAAHNPMVVQAAQRFGKCLIREWDDRKIQGSKLPQYHFAELLNRKVKFLLLPTALDGEKLGLDDFLVKFKTIGLQDLTAKALPLQSVKLEKGELKITSHYTGELLGPYTPVKGGLDKISATHYRGLMVKYTLGADVRYVPDHGGMKYDEDKGIWEPISKGAWSLLPDTVCRVNNWQNRRATLKQENFDLAREELAIEFDQFNHPKYIGFRNGVLVKEPEGSSSGFANTFFISHSREHLLTRRLGFDYDPHADCPKFKKFLEGMCGGKGTLFWTIRSLFRWSLEPKEKGKKYGFDVWPILLGPPGSGKGTLLYVLQALVGFDEGCATFTIKSLSTQEPEKKLAKLLDKYVSIDLDYKGHLDESTLAILNKVISNEPVDVKRLWQNEHSTPLNTVLWAAANKSPSVSNGDGEGFSRRAMILKISPRKGEADRTLVDQLAKELPGIYNWVQELSLEAAFKNIENFKSSKVALDTHQEWIISNNTAMAWLFEWVEGSSVEEREGYFKDFYSDYRGWCGDEGHKTPLKAIGFSKYLVAAGAEKVTRHRDRGWWMVLPEAEKIQWGAIG
ncbi:DUF3854 domain-containing protein [Leptothoe sp. EHU-05/26/07-4]